MRYTTFQILDEANVVLDNKLEESIWEDEIDQEENDLLYDYNPVKVIAAEKAKAAKSTLE